MTEVAPPEASIKELLTKPHRVKPTSGRMGRPSRAKGASLTETAASESDPAISQANTVLQERVTKLSNDIGLEPGKKLGAWQTMKYRKALGELEGLQFVLHANGELSPFLKKAELKRLAATTQDQTITDALAAIEPQAQEATTKFYDILRKNNVENDVIAAIDRDPGAAFTTNKEIIKRLSKLHLQQYFFSSTTPSSAKLTR